MEWVQKLIRRIRLFGIEDFGRFYGCYRGFVVDNNDPKQLGRLLIEVPVVYGTDNYNVWATSKGMYAGKLKGFFALPAKGDTVWVSFEGGDISSPIWEYGWFGDGDIDDTIKTDYPENQVWVIGGVKIEVNSKTNYIRLTAKDGRVIEVNKDGVSLGTTEKSSEPAVLGDKNEEALKAINEKLDKLLDEVNSLGTTLIQFAATNTAAISSAQLLAPLAGGYAGLTQGLIELPINLATIKAEIATLNTNEIPATKSDVVSLD